MLKTAYQFGVLTMSGNDDTQFLRQDKRLIHLSVVHPKKVFVRKKDFEGSRPVSHDLAQLGFCVFIEPAYRHMEGVIAGAPALSFILPQAISCQRVLGPGRAAHLNHCCRPPNECRDAGRLMSILGKGRHERQIDVDVGIDETGENKFAGGIDDLRTGRDGKICTDASDGFVCDEDIGLVARVRRYDLAITNE